MERPLVDTMAPIMWVFIIIFVGVLIFGLIKFLFLYAANNPCTTYNFLSHYFGTVSGVCENSTFCK